MVEEVREGREFLHAAVGAGQLVGDVGLPETAYRTALEDRQTGGMRDPRVSQCFLAVSRLEKERRHHGHCLLMTA